VAATTQAPDTGRSRRGWSYYGTFLECQRKFAFKNRSYPGDPVWPERGPGGSMGLGSFVHELLAAYYLHKMGRGADPREGLPRTRWALAAKFGVPQEDADEMFSRFMLYALEYAYDDWTPLAVEQEFSIWFKADDPRDPSSPVRVVPEGTPGAALFTARLDLVARNNAGKILSVDHKSAAIIFRKDPDTGKVYTPATNYGTTGQMHGHEHIGEHILAQGFRQPFGGVVLNFFQTQGSDAAFKRERPSAAPQMVEGFPRTIWMAAGMIAMYDKVATSVLHWPPVSGYFCNRCAFSKACRFGSAVG